MRFVDFETFMRLPAGTVYTTYNTPPMVTLSTDWDHFGKLCIKGNTLDREESWESTPLLPAYDALNVQAGDRSEPLDYDASNVATAQSLDGELVVLEAFDLAALISKLSQCLGSVQSLKIDYGTPPSERDRINNAIDGFLTGF